MEKENNNKENDFCSIPNLKKEYDLDEINDLDANTIFYSGTGRDKDGRNFNFSGTCDGKLKSKKEIL